MQEESFEVQYTQEGERLDKVLSEIYPDFSRSFFQKLIKNKQIQVNGAVQKASYPVHTEDLIRVTIPDAVETTIEPENIPLDILYEDNDVLKAGHLRPVACQHSGGKRRPLALTDRSETRCFCGKVDAADAGKQAEMR